MQKFLKEQVVLLVTSFLFFSAEPAILQAQEINPLPFTEALSVSRGSVTPTSSDEAYTLSAADACKIARENWGWADCTGLDAYIGFQFPETDTTVILKPESIGFVKLDDWAESERNKVVKEIEKNQRDGLRAQSERLGVDIKFDGWAVYPTLNTDKKFMYYATKSMWDGEPNINIEATIFDRRGHVKFLIVPTENDIDSAAAEAIIVKTLDQYAPAQGQDYASFVTGDKVAAVGAVGVLAALAGVQYGKGAMAGIIAGGLLLLKKLWFILLLPIIWLKRLFSRKDQ